MLAFRIPPCKNRGLNYDKKCTVLKNNSVFIFLSFCYTHGTPCVKGKQKTGEKIDSSALLESSRSTNQQQRNERTAPRGFLILCLSLAGSCGTRGSCGVYDTAVMFHIRLEREGPLRAPRRKASCLLQPFKAAGGERKNKGDSFRTRGEGYGN